MTFQRNLISLYSAVLLRPSVMSRAVSPKMVEALNLEIGMFGYTLDGPVMDQLKLYSEQELKKFRDMLHDTLGGLTGATSIHRTLFNKFPYDVPEQHEYLMNRLLGYMENEFGDLEATNFERLSCGHVIDPSKFDLAAFGACPICQQQVLELDSPDVAKFDFKSVTPLRVLRLATNEFVGAKVSGLLARNSSLSQQERDFIFSAPDGGINYRIDKPSKVFRETLPLVYRIWQGDIAELVNSATDILRIATFLSKEDADLSLKDNVKFKISTSDKKKLLRLLDSMNNLEEDLMRHREKWLRLGERLNPGSKENTAKYPKVALAFGKLRNNPKKIKTFSRTVEKDMRAKKITASLLDTLEARPGEYMRRLDFLLRTSRTPNVVLRRMEENVVGNVTTKMLLEMYKYLDARPSKDEAPKDRIFLPKGSVTKMQVRPDHRAPISHGVLLCAQKIVQEELERRFAKKEAMGKVYIDGALRNVILPYNRRADAGTSMPIMKGSRFRISKKAEVLRMFVHWTKDTDVDLSLLLLDENFNTLDQVSFTNLRSAGIMHSGDLQSAPNGGSEFIDLEMALVKNAYPSARYAAMSIISYRGLTFDQFPCYAGFMERDALKSGMKYEPESVALKFDVNSPTTNHMPLIYDMETREIVFADLTAGENHAGGSVHRKHHTLAMLVQGVMELPKRKPTVYDVLWMNVRARGNFAIHKSDADKVFTLTDFDMEEVLQMTADA